MEKQQVSDSEQDADLDRFAAELTDAAYPVALKYGVSGAYIDLELEIWRALTELVRRRGRELLRRNVTVSSRAAPAL
jgi:hypothetical protein